MLVALVDNPFHYAFVQRGALELVLLSIAAGVLGTWIVLRGLAFFSHAVGTAAFPGLVLADGLGFPAPLGAFGAAALFSVGVQGTRTRNDEDYDARTALVLVGALALGVILASDVFHSGSNVDTLLFGSLLVIDGRDLALAAAVAAAALVANRALGPRWLAVGFDPRNAGAFAGRPAALDAALLAFVAAGIVSGLAALGALLVTALFVVPAATVGLFARSLGIWQIAATLLAAVEGVAGLWLSVELNAPPGPAIAVLAGGVFAFAAGARALRQRLGRSSVAVAAATLLLALLATGCGATSGGSGPVVVATTTQIGDWVREVGGPAVTVHQILQPNTDPHAYEPRPNDVTATADAALIFENGDNLDRWMSTIVSAAGGNASIVDLGEFVPIRFPGESSGPEASRFDPHWWHDPVNAEAAVSRIERALAAADPAHAAGYKARADRYLARLRLLDTGIATCLDTVPPATRKLVTDHDAFGYFGWRYGIRVIGAIIPSQTTQGEPSAGETADLIRLIEREHVKAIFPESSLNSKLAHTIAQETGATVGQTLYGDTLGPAGSPGATYISMERANADAMVRGFTGNAHGCRWTQ